MSLKLPRFLRTLSIVDEKGAPTLAFHQWWESVLKQIETSINGIQDALTAAGIANAAAVAAQNAASTAQNAVKLTTSGTTGLTITATDAGSNVTITISSHTRVYGDGATVSVNSGSLTGLNYTTTYYIYYDDSSFAGGAVTYQATTSQMTAAQTGVRHLVGGVTTPAAGGTPSDGGGFGPPGFGTEIP